ncbi:MAG: HpcH/HpaI aldolase/citrate lyase family protein [Planctomycetota bacterium]|nr:HpcH/HpaI aldolase/citrate lyase family protein [Planctomycetota bacterium]
MKAHLHDAWGLGVPLYVPGDHPRLEETLSGGRCPGAGTVIICLEDALRAENGANAEARLLSILPTLPTMPTGPHLFCRPRDLDQLARLARSEASSRLTGFVLPKVSPESWAAANDLTEHHGGWLMPVLETALVFRPSLMEIMLDALLKRRERLLATRLGGNDLGGLLGIRRTRGVYAYDGPTGAILSITSAMLLSHGIPVSGVVFEHLDDTGGLTREAVDDAGRGLIPKAAVHPEQVGVISTAYRVMPTDVEQARQILVHDAPAVFQSHGAMAEPATHAPWARSILDRLRVFGETPQHESIN